MSRIDENSFDESEVNNFDIGSKVDLDSDADKKSESIRKYSKESGELLGPHTQRSNPTISFKAGSVKNGKRPIDMTARDGPSEDDITSITPRDGNSII